MMADWKVNENYKRTIEAKAYAEYMSAEQAKIIIEKKPASKEQALSAQKVLDMTDAQLVEYRERIIDPIKATTYHPSLVTGKWSADQISHFEHIRRRGKNNLGASEISSASKERKKLAVEAFSHSPPAELTESQKANLSQLDPITMFRPEKVETKKPTMFDAFMKMFKTRIDDTSGGRTQSQIESEKHFGVKNKS